MGIESAVKTLVVCQSQEVSIPPRQGEVPRLYRLLSRHLNKRRVNQGYM